MSSIQQDTVNHYLDELPETEQMMRDLANGQNILEISNRTGIPRWQISLRIAKFGLNCLDLAVFRSEERLGFPCHGVESFNEEQSKSVVLSTMAHMMTGTPLGQSLVIAQCQEAQIMEAEKAANDDSDETPDTPSSTTFSDIGDNITAKANAKVHSGKGNRNKNGNGNGNGKAKD